VETRRSPNRISSLMVISNSSRRLYLSCRKARPPDVSFVGALGIQGLTA
jgi:NADPH-dependent curcumin reductase CurA